MINLLVYFQLRNSLDNSFYFTHTYFNQPFQNEIWGTWKILYFSMLKSIIDCEKIDLIERNQDSDYLYSEYLISLGITLIRNNLPQHNKR
jgi:hypothetical protein